MKQIRQITYVLEHGDIRTAGSTVSFRWSHQRIELCFDFCRELGNDQAKIEVMVSPCINRVTASFVYHQSGRNESLRLRMLRETANSFIMVATHLLHFTVFYGQGSSGRNWIEDVNNSHPHKLLSSCTRTYKRQVTNIPYCRV